MQCRGVTEIIFPPTSLQPALTPLAPEQQRQAGTIKAKGRYSLYSLYSGYTLYSHYSEYSRYCLYSQYPEYFQYSGYTLYSLYSHYPEYSRYTQYSHYPEYSRYCLYSQYPGTFITLSTLCKNVKSKAEKVEIWKNLGIAGKTTARRTASRCVGEPLPDIWRTLVVTTLRDSTARAPWEPLLQGFRRRLCRVTHMDSFEFPFLRSPWSQATADGGGRAPARPQPRLTQRSSGSQDLEETKKCA